MKLSVEFFFVGNQFNNVLLFCCLRVGLVGNPSDGFHGKTISLSVANFWAEVTIKESQKLVRKSESYKIYYADQYHFVSNVSQILHSH